MTKEKRDGKICEKECNEVKKMLPTEEEINLHIYSKKIIEYIFGFN